MPADASSRSATALLDQLRTAFLDEAAELLESLESSLLALERHPEDGRLVDEAFRAAHTLKGSSGTVGFGAVAAVTHELENGLQRLRAGGERLTPSLLAALLGAVDTLRAVLAAPEATDVAETVAGLRLAFGNGTMPTSEAPRREAARALALGELPEPARAAAGAEVAEGRAVHHVRFALARDAFTRGLDPLRLLDALGAEGEILWARVSADELPTLDTLDPAECHLGVEATLSGASDVEALQAVFEFCPPGSSIDVAAVHGRRASDHPAVAGDERDATPSAASSARAIRVPQARLDAVVDLVGELVTARNGLLHLQGEADAGAVDPAFARRLKEVAATVNRAVSDLQSDVLRLRMVPVRAAFERLHRVVRDGAAATGKQVALEIVGEDTEVDKTVVDALVDPLVHLARNAIVHGFESDRDAVGKPAVGRLQVGARRVGNTVVITVADDGAGIDAGRVRAKAVRMGVLDADAAARLPDAGALQLVFAPGLSTADRVSDLSGRGVGMDAVRSTVVRLGGEVTLDSTRGVGTSVTLTLPLTLSVIRALMVRTAGQTLALPLDAVRETARVRLDRCATVRGRPVVRIAGQLLAVVPASDVLALAPGGADAPDADGTTPLVVLEGAGARIALSVDALGQPQEILVKPLAGYLLATGALAGAAVLGDGQVALVAEPARLVSLALDHEVAA